jgi:hypothetical protein
MMMMKNSAVRWLAPDKFQHMSIKRDNEQYDKVPAALHG